MASGGSAADLADQPDTPLLEGSPSSAYKVEFWVLGGAGSLAGVPTEWQLFNRRWADRWDQIPALVHDWEKLGGMWVRSQLHIEEYELRMDGNYRPVNRL